MPINWLRLGLIALLCTSWAHAQEAPAAPTGEPAAASGGTEDLAKAAQNPLSSMVSVPIQYNLNLNAERYYLDTGPALRGGLLRWYGDDAYRPDGSFRPRDTLRRRLDGLIEEEGRTQHVVNVQPVIPLTFGNVNVINRLIIPVLDQPIGEDDREFGLGDIQYTMFFSPAQAGKVIWGVGPAFSLPTATDDALGTGKWSAGPGAVVLAMPGKWVIGALAMNLWSFAGEDDRPDVNSMMIQPFINRNFSKGWYATTSPIITANWNADSDSRWTVPVGGGFGKIFTIGKQPMNAQLGAYYNVEKPDGAPDWNVRFQLQFMFPR